MSMKPQRSHNASRLGAGRVSKQWHAVTIISKSSSCEAARAAKGTRYLSAEAPRLPLAECSKPDACTCAYKHHADRRAEARRADDGGGLRSSSPTPERRMQPDRRNND
jgi:hypothetical protein